MFRKVFHLGALAAALSFASAQSVPVATGPIPDQVGNTNGADLSIGLSSYFAIDGVSGDIMRFETIFGDLDVEMLDGAAPNHVVNFQGYAERGDYDDSIIHRMADFLVNDAGIDIIQGGGFTAEVPFDLIPTLDPIDLEYDEPNVRGTLAAARTTLANSATSQWYFNVNDNSDTLGPELNPPGFTVFGRVIGNGMEVVDQIAATPRFRFQPPMDEIPLVDYEITDDVTPANYVVVRRIREVPMYPRSDAPVGALSFSAISSDESVVVAAVSNSSVILTPGAAGAATITVTATDVRGLEASQTFAFTTAGIEITSQPEDADVAAGGDTSFTVVAIADDPLSYQWYRQRASESEATALPGATSATLALTGLAAADMGFYWVEISSGDSLAVSDIATLTLSGGTSRLANLSARGLVEGSGTLTPGFVLRGGADKDLVIRGIGPTLADFGVTTAMTDSTLDLIPQGQSESILANDNWGDSANAAALATVSAAVGAFPLGDDSLDAAVLASVPAATGSAYTVLIRERNGEGGVALAEIYDPEAIGAAVELSNLSARGFSGLGAAVLSPGFVIDGTGAKTMLVRVVGPSLEEFGVTDTMSDPQLELLTGGQMLVVASNDDWGGTAELTAAFAAAGAFDLSSDDSLDAAVLVRLPPGAYTVRPSGADNGVGVILVEVYEVVE